MKIKQILLVALFSLSFTSLSAKHVVPIYTSCGKIAHIDLDRTTWKNSYEQIKLIDRTLCPQNYVDNTITIDDEN
jgi:hypothetical protein